MVEKQKCLPQVSKDREQQHATISRKLRWFLATIFIFMFALTAVVTTAMVLSLNVRKRETTVIYKPMQPPPERRTALFRSGRNETEEQQEHIEVVGDGNRFLLLKRGSRLRHWKESTRTGKVKLKHHSYIVIQVPGLYRVYGQYAVYQPSDIRSRTMTVSVLLMQNRMELSMSVAENCRKLCTRSFSKTAELQKGDKLSLQSGTGGIFRVDPKCSYFGINLLQSNKGRSSKDRRDIEVQTNL